MFFIISKILSFLITPLVWITIFLALSLFIKDKNKSKKFLITTIVLFLFFTNSFIAYEFMRLLETPIESKTELKSSYDVGIVLGGGMVTLDKKADRLIFNKNTDRIMQAVSLYKTNRVKKLLLSSGSGNLVFRDMIESNLLRKYLIQIGIPDQDILIDSTSDNTYQNAVNSVKLLKANYPEGNFLIITSAFHMKRAQKCFAKVGLKADTYSTNKYAGERRFTFDMMVVPDVVSFEIWNKVLHETVGTITYWLMGYI